MDRGFRRIWLRVDFNLDIRRGIWNLAPAGIFIWLFDDSDLHGYIFVTPLFIMFQDWTGVGAAGAWAHCVGVVLFLEAMYCFVLCFVA